MKVNMKQFDQYLAEISDGDRNDRGNGIGGLAKYNESEWDGALEAVDAAMTVLCKALRLRGTEAADATMRTQAVKVLGNIGTRSPAVVPELLRLIREDSDTGVRTEVARALGRIGVGAKAASDALAAVLSDQDGEDALRCEAARSLGRVDSLGPGTDAALGNSVADLVAKSPRELIITCGQSIPLEESSFWAGVRGGMQKAAAQHPTALEVLGQCPEVATFVVRGVPDVALSYLHAMRDDRESSVLRVVEWIHRIESEEERTKLRRVLLTETHDDAGLPLLEELLRDLPKEYVSETLETLAESTQGFARASIRRVVSDFVCDRFPSESIQWGMHSPSLPSRFVPDVIASAFPLSLEGLDHLLRLNWTVAENRCEVWSAFVERAATKQLPQWFIRRSADDPAFIEPFAGCAALSPRAIRALEAIEKQCGYIPVARSDCAELFLQTLPPTSLRDRFVSKAVDSAICEHMLGNVSDAKLAEILRLPVCSEWCEQVPVDRIQDLLLSPTQQEAWQSAWSTLSILPRPLFQRVAEQHLIAGFIRSYRALWSEEVAQKWALILERGGKELPYDKWLRLLMEASAFCLRNPGLPVGNVVTSAFPPLYEAVVTNKANSITDELFGYFDWDKAKKLRKDVIEAYMSSCWPPEDLALTASKCQILRKVFNRLRKKWGGDGYLRSVAEGLRRRKTPEMLAVLGELSEMMNDPDFFEAWD